MFRVDWRKFFPAWGTGVVIFIAACALYYPPWEEVFKENPLAREAPVWSLLALGMLGLTFLFTYAYAKGYEGRGWAGEGIRYGLTLGLFVASGYLIGYAFVESSGTELALHMVGSVLKLILVALGVAFVYRPQGGARAAPVA